ncbi:MAG: enamine deaminase RidA [Rhodospirillaceae bacterium]|jgi:2-iminobutanoate/2-iminopropanoate deaminase|nr:enamine deaminase RidA [Rhodospirillaceae bacterium]|tara:strand:+ start:1681 stop:2070 length:390 start_codon:yes stop_codon:yes gene_type:complete
MNEFVNPKKSHNPVGAYSHSVRIPRDSDILVIAGQVGVDAKGKLQDGIRRQSEQAFRNVIAALRANKMAKGDLVKLTIFLTDPRHIDAYRTARKKVIGDDTLPASTLVIVDGLASPDMLIEVEGMAAKS